MTPKEAIEILDAIARRNVFCTLEAEPISAFELAHISLEKQIPKKPTINKKGDVIRFLCPECGYDSITQRGAYYNHCYICGQAIDWNTTEE